MPSFLPAEMPLQFLDVRITDRRAQSLLAREHERRFLRWSRPWSVSRQATGGCSDLVRFHPRDREEHLAVAHSVEALERLGHHPEDLVEEHPVEVRLLPKRTDTVEPRVGQLRLIPVANPTPHDINLPRGGGVVPHS